VQGTVPDQSPSVKCSDTSSSTSGSDQGAGSAPSNIRELESVLAELESMSVTVLGIQDESALEAGCLSCS
jgi:hypothetical protein